MEETEFKARALKEKLTIFVVTVVYEGIQDAAFGPFFNKKTAIGKAKSLIDEPVFDSGEDNSEDYPWNPTQEVFVWELTTGKEGSRVLILAE